MEDRFEKSTWVPRPERGPDHERPEESPGLQEIPVPEKKKPPVNPEIIRGILDNLDDEGFEKEKEKKPPTLH